MSYYTMAADFNASHGGRGTDAFIVSVHADVIIRRGSDEDGDYEYAAGIYYVAMASHIETGLIYGCGREFADSQQAIDYVDSLDQMFNPESDPEWHFVRKPYGSPTWNQDDEIGMMDDAERAFHGF